jgi:hypothetical protein
MTKLVRLALVALLTLAPGAALALQTSAVTPNAVIADPPADPKFPARMEVIHAPTDHSWSDKRILLQSLIINWLQDQLARPRP